MKRSSFLIAGASATVAGCANGGLPSTVSEPNAGLPRRRERITSGRGNQMLGSLILLPYFHFYAVEEFAVCDGARVPIAAATTLFSLLGTTFGGDGKTYFKLPDLRGKAPIEGLKYHIAVKGRYPPRHKDHVHHRYEAVPPLLGQLLLVPYLPGKLPPKGWAMCDGSIMNIKANEPLYSLIGPYFGGDARSTFALPDLRNHRPHKHLTYLIALEGRFPSFA